jgi:hypothetical protein
LQPYAGIGPVLQVIYGRLASAKELAMDVEAGVRYLMLKNVSAFLAYKKVWNVELGPQ